VSRFIVTADDEIAEAEFVVHQLRTLERQHPEMNWGSFAVLYRTNAQSRPFEESLVLWRPLQHCWGLKFYDRKEIKDALAYLRVIVNAADRVSLLRVLILRVGALGKPAWTRSRRKNWV